MYIIEADKRDATQQLDGRNPVAFVVHSLRLQALPVVKAESGRAAIERLGELLLVAPPDGVGIGDATN